MTGVGQQCRGTRENARDGFANHEGQIDHQADPITPVAGIDRPVAVPMPVVMVMVMAVVRVIVAMTVMIMVVMRMVRVGMAA
jgi:hypothetical protein